MLPSTKKALTFTFNSVFLLLVELPTLNTPKTIQLKIKQVRKLDYTSQDWLQNVDILKKNPHCQHDTIFAKPSNKYKNEKCILL